MKMLPTNRWEYSPEIWANICENPYRKSNAVRLGRGVLRGLNVGLRFFFNREISAKSGEKALAPTVTPLPSPQPRSRCSYAGRRSKERTRDLAEAQIEVLHGLAICIGVSRGRRITTCTTEYICRRVRLLSVMLADQVGRPANRRAA